MEYTRLGNTGMKVSRICLGCMGFGDAERWVQRDAGDAEGHLPIPIAASYMALLRSTVARFAW